MRVLVIGGTGVIGTGIVQALLARGADVSVYSRGVRGGSRSPGVTQLTGDRRDAAAFEHQFADMRFDVIVDLLCFSRADVESTVSAFGGRCQQILFCSTVCVYGDRVPPDVLVSE